MARPLLLLGNARHERGQRQTIVLRALAAEDEASPIGVDEQRRGDGVDDARGGLEQSEVLTGDGHMRERTQVPPEIYVGELRPAVRSW